MKVYLFNILLGRPISFSARETLAAERGSSRLGSTRRLIKVSVTIMLVIIVIASVVFSIYFYFVPVTDSSPALSHSGHAAYSAHGN